MAFTVCLHQTASFLCMNEAISLYGRMYCQATLSGYRYAIRLYSDMPFFSKTLIQGYMNIYMYVCNRKIKNTYINILTRLQEVPIQHTIGSDWTRRMVAWGLFNSSCLLPLGRVGSKGRCGLGDGYGWLAAMASKRRHTLVTCGMV